MGACKSTNKHNPQDKSNYNKNTDVVASNKPHDAKENNDKIIQLERSPERVAKKSPPSKHKIRFVLDKDVLDEKVYIGDEILGNITSTLKPKLMADSDYDLLLINPVSNTKQDITKRTNEQIKNLFPLASDPENYINVVEVAYAGLIVASDIKKAYAESTSVVGSPKYENSPNPFEIISFNKMTNSLSYQLYQDESFSYLKSFNEFSAYCNGNNKIYISGSDKKNEDDSYNNLFVEIDLVNINKPDHIKQLPNLITGRGWHSMIYVPPRSIFIVGGVNTKSVELYDTEKKQISFDSNLNEIRSEVSLCCLNNGYLYAFSGFLINNNFLNTIEKCNLKAKNRTWEIVNLVTDQSCIYEPSFFSVTYGKGNSIILLGGNEDVNQKSSCKNYIFELKDGVETLSNYQVNSIEDTYLCSEKFFMPINDKVSILMPIFSSETVKILFFDNDSSSLSVVKFEVLETAEDDIRNSLNLNADNRFAEKNPLNRIHDEERKDII